MLSEKEIRRLKKNPLLWLRQHARDSYVQTIPSHLIEVECWRWVHVTACRWFGEQVFLDDIRPASYEDVAWSQPDAYGDTDTPAPIDELKEKRKLDAKRKKLSAARQDLVDRILKPLMRSLRAEVPDLPTPVIVTFQSYWTITWSSPQLNLTVSGKVGSGLPEAVCFVYPEDLDSAEELEWEEGIFKMSWTVFQAAQRRPLAP